MAKYYGKIGFAVTSEDTPGVWNEHITARPYCGDILNNTKRIDGSESLNDNINITNRISIVADPYAKLNFHTIRYATYMGTKWKVSSVQLEYPRLILNLGGIYNGPDSE